MTPGVQCRSLSDTYQDSVHGRTPDQLARERDRVATQAALTAQSPQAPLETAIMTADGEPLGVADTAHSKSPKGEEPNASQASKANVDTNGASEGVAPTTQEAAQPRARQAHPSRQARPVLRPMTHVPARVPEVIVTIWMAPWTDDEGDFHEGEKIHARAFDARWASARRRADLADKHRAVIQLPFTAIERRDMPVDTPQTAESVQPVGATYGTGARAFQSAKRKALEGTNFIEKRFKEAQPLVSDEAPYEEETEAPMADDTLGVVAATEHGRLVSQVGHAGAH